MSDTDETDPFSNGCSNRGDRHANGQFKIGNPGGPGNPRAAQARQVRARLDSAQFKVCSEDRLVAMYDAILRRAEAGDVQAAKLIIEHVKGPPLNTEVAERIENIEQALAEKN